MRSFFFDSLAIIICVYLGSSVSHYAPKSFANIKSVFIRVYPRPKNNYDSRVLRNEMLLTPSGPEGSSGRNFFRVPQGSLAITPHKQHRA
jgi:hypothetical protein